MQFSIFGRRWLALLAALPLLLSACSPQQTLQGLFQKDTPHAAYARSLRRAGLDRSALGQSWLAAADRALRDSLVVSLPFTETGYFRPEQPTAAGYRFSARAGELVHVELTLAPGAPARVFVDAFEVGPGRAGAPTPLASADTLRVDFRYRAEHTDRQHLLRVQPELLAAGRYTLRLSREPSLSAFPVRGRTEAAIGSFWGAERDQGARRHEGVDIFAPRGTPVIAATAGTITRVAETSIGGRVVWLSAADLPHHLYYAHLDRQLVQAGQQVRLGDTLGLVGNTGNARTTTPHLHFGVYGRGGAQDPLPFLARTEPALPLPAGPDRRAEWVRLRRAAPLQALATALPPPPGRSVNTRGARSQVALRTSLAKSAAAALLPPRTPLLVLGRNGAFLRVENPSGQRGYVALAAVEPAAALRRLALPAATELLARPGAASTATAALPARTAVAVLGESQGFALLRGPDGEIGWARI
ncbi:M23 family metallopeptidase [uncultured Hymenobacter sp.]|uniref:M23 family metallopeptidase n=1 Tax=uncultured Hymenobacter sp. TaxID=170016 RepID=UPI0035CBFAB3